MQNEKSKIQNGARRWQFILLFAFCILNCGKVLAAESGLTVEELAGVEFWLAIIGGLLFGLIVGLIVLALAIRYIAKHSTQPCRWCMEFIPKRETVCPRCGKSLVKPLEGGS